MKKMTGEQIALLIITIVGCFVILMTGISSSYPSDNATQSTIEYHYGHRYIKFVVHKNNYGNIYDLEHDPDCNHSSHK